MSKEQPNDNEITPEHARERIWELSEKIDICMFTTWDGERQRSRPLSARIKRDEHAVYFLVGVEGSKNAEIEQFPWVSCAWADNANWKYVVIEGKAKLSNDRAKIKDLWNDSDRAWWEDENDPTIRLITVTPEDAELWDSPNKLVATAKMAFAAITGAAPKMGDNKEVKL